ncbi:MAG TPA: hypothetical protein VHM30_11560, partial [Gemmatimonadaceae bacterium]|nr:hypothetical protein [Gemmatimonadaceae bacterium]
MRSIPCSARSLTAAVIAAALPLPALAQAARPDRAATLDAVATWIALDVTPGREALVAPAMTALGFARAPLDGFMIRKGTGSPRRLVACSLDQA